jgi:hypothetical protein
MSLYTENGRIPVKLLFLLWSIGAIGILLLPYLVGIPLVDALPISSGITFGLLLAR